MGAWDIGPLANDAAADWVENLFKDTPLSARLEETLRAELREHVDEIRAAAFLVLVLSEQGFLDRVSKRRFAKLAASRLSEMLRFRLFTNGNFIAEIRSEMLRLEDIVRGGAD